MSLCAFEPCLKPKEENLNWIQCDQCRNWFHFMCLGWKENQQIDKNLKFICPKCTNSQKDNSELSKILSLFEQMRVENKQVIENLNLKMNEIKENLERKISGEIKTDRVQGIKEENKNTEITNKESTNQNIMSKEVSKILTKGMVEWKIGTFTGEPVESPEKFLNNCKEIFKLADLDKDCWVGFTTNHLKGEAARWWDGKNFSLYTWEDFEKSFLTKFDDSGLKSQLKAKLYGEAQESGESVEKFIEKKVKLFQRLFPKEDTNLIVNQIIELIHPSIRLYLRSTDNLDIDTLLKFVRRIEADIKTNKIREQRDAWDLKGDKGGVRCYRCKQSGHYANNEICPMFTKQENRRGNDQEGEGSFWKV